MPVSILIADGTPANRLVLKEILGPEYVILESDGGVVDVLLRERENVAAVLLDAHLADSSGFDALCRIRSHELLCGLPVVMTAGSDEENGKIKALSLGASDFVARPYNPEVIRHCLKNAAALRKARAAAPGIARDSLTGLYSRESFFEAAGGMASAREPGFYTMACFDIAKFKVINDQYGAQKGDEVLRHTAKVLYEGFAPHGGICCRVSADNFAILYPTSFKDSPEMNAIHERVSRVEGLASPLMFSVGRFTVNDVGMPPASMYDRAMLAADSIKGRYDTKIAVYDEAMRLRLLREQQIVHEMEDALKERRFEVWFQPQYNHSTRAMIGAEALVRWRHPRRGLISPAEFISLFERNGFIYALDKFVWEFVCRCLREWTDAGLKPLPVSVNVSRYDLFQSDMVETVTGLVEKYGLPRELVRLEITESAFSDDSGHMVEVVKRLVNAGFTVEIDDFGSGFSSLNTLKNVPAQIIKLDMKFLEGGGDSKRGGNIMQSVVRMAKWLDVSVIAEGVETARQADYLRSIGCDYVQGFLYARPMPAEEYASRHAVKEDRLLALKTVENLNNNSFWDPNSIDTLIFNSYVGGACIFEYHDGGVEVLRVTEKYARVIGSAGMTIEDALKLNWTEYMSPESLARFTADLRESISSREEVTGEYAFIDLPGCPRETYLRSSLRVIASAGRRFLVYCMNENITAQRKAEILERKTSEQLQTMMDDMPGGFVRMSVSPEGNLYPVYVNEGLARLVGMSRDEAMNAYFNDPLAGIHPDDTATVNNAVAKLLGGDETQSLRYRLKHGSGGYVWLSVLGRKTKDASGNAFLNVYFSDASEQIRREEAQKQILDNLPCGAGVYEFKNGQMNLTYQNKSYWELVGLNEAAFPDTAPMSAVHPDDISLIMRELILAIERGRDVACDIRLRHLSAGYIPVRLVGRIIQKEQGGFLIYATFTPIENI